MNTLQWDAAAERAFRRLETAPSQDFSQLFILKMDASDTGLGALLSQMFQGEERSSARNVPLPKHCL